MAAREGSDRYGVGPSAFWFYHPHNQYISALSTRGFAGFILLLAMLVMPFWYAVRRSSHAKDRKSTATIIYLSCLAYMIFGLSDVPLEGKATIIFYVVFIAWLLCEFDRDSGKERLEERAE
jgi:O-antigen ligase